MSDWIQRNKRTGYRCGISIQDTARIYIHVAGGKKNNFNRLTEFETAEYRYTKEDQPLHCKRCGRNHDTASCIFAKDTANNA